VDLSIAVIGAGPAGSSAAFHLACAGCKVTLVDRAAFPREKVCGDWLTPLALAELARLGLDDVTLAEALPDHARIRLGALIAPSGRRSLCGLPTPGACVPRLQLDAAIRARAIAAGCTPLQRTVRDLASDASLAQFDVIVDARGANVGEPNAVGLRAYWTLPHAALDHEARETVTLQTDAAFPRGYGWWFPVARDATSVRLNVGVGLLARDSRPGHHVSDFFKRFTGGQPQLRRWSELARERSRPVGYHVGLADAQLRVAHGRVLRIGDAANLADPLTGDGIGNALRSGMLVAAAIADSRDATEAGQRWQASFEREFAPDLRIALRLRRALQPTFAKNAAAAVLARSTRLRANLHGALFGAAPYRSLVPGRAPPS
jgi:flavin-dependent dehydrogenase